MKIYASQQVEQALSERALTKEKAREFLKAMGLSCHRTEFAGDWKKQIPARECACGKNDCKIFDKAFESLSGLIPAEESNTNHKNK